ncbi:MAG: NUDIX hydrolase [Chlamydiota bacterium]|nr:NUDIX hydrolase [Chlamydiota bacterium]
MKHYKVLHEGKYKRLVNKSGWEYTERIHCDGVVVILALKEDDHILLVEQFRIPVNANVIEFPAGLSGDNQQSAGETLENAAKRELLEETGYHADHMNLILQGPVSSASSSDIMSVFRASGLKKVSNGGGDETEDIQVHEIALNKVEHWLDQKAGSGCLIDPKVYAGLYFLKKEPKEHV